MKPKKTHPSKSSRLAGIVLTASVITVCCSAVQAADIEWDAGGGIDTDFNTPANWVNVTADPDINDVLPGAGDAALANGTITIASDVGSSGSRLGVLELGRFFGTGTLSQTAGTVYTSGFNVGFVGTGTYDLNGSGSIDMTNDFLLGHSGGGTDAGAGTFNMNTTGSFTTNYVKIADSSWGANMTSGTFNHSAGTTTSTYGFGVGGNATKGGVSYKGVMNLSGGTVHSNGNFKIGDGLEGAKGEFTMTGGTLNVTGPNGTEFWVGNGHAGDYSTVGSGTATFSSGTLNVGSWFGVGRAGAQGTVTISGDAVVNQGTADAGSRFELTNFTEGGTATVNLDGGVLTVRGVRDNGDDDGLDADPPSTTTFNFNGGTLKASQDMPNFWDALIGGLNRANVRNGGAVIHTNGFSVISTQALLHSDIGGDNAIDGGLTKDGTGTLTLLDTVNTFTGAVVVNSGTLNIQVGNSPASGAITQAVSVAVNNGGTLRAALSNAFYGYDGTADNSDITVNAGGILTMVDDADVSVRRVILNGGDLAAEGILHTGYGSWGFKESGDGIDATANSTASAPNLCFQNGADINVSSGVTLNVTGSITDTGAEGSSTLIKNGTGTLTLSGASSYSGNTTVNGGTLSVTSAFFNDVADVTVATGATLNLNHSNTDSIDELFVNGVQQAAGLYRASDANGGSGIGTVLSSLTGAGKLEVLTDPPTPAGYADWQTANSTAGTADQDHDNDGVENGVEYFIGGTTNTTGFTALPGVTTVGAVRSVTWTQGSGYAGSYGTGFVVQTSSSLTAWAPAVTGTSGEAGKVYIDGSTVTYTFPTGVINFVRLVVTP